MLRLYDTSSKVPIRPGRRSPDGGHLRLGGRLFSGSGAARIPPGDGQTV